MNQKPTSSFKSLKPLKLLTIFILIALVAGTGGYLLGIRTNQRASRSTQRISFQPSPTTPVPTTKAVGWKTYIDIDYGYQANYPQEFTSRQKGVDVLFGSETVRFSMFRRLFQNANPNRETINTIWFINNFDKLLGDYYGAIGSSPDLTIEGIIVDGRKSAVKVTEKRCEFTDAVHINIFIPRDRDILDINFYDIQDGLSCNPEIINSFISTFITTFRFSD